MPQKIPPNFFLVVILNPSLFGLEKVPQFHFMTATYPQIQGIQISDFFPRGLDIVGLLGSPDLELQQSHFQPPMKSISDDVVFAGPALARL